MPRKSAKQRAEILSKVTSSLPPKVEKVRMLSGEGAGGGGGQKPSTKTLREQIKESLQGDSQKTDEGRKERKAIDIAKDIVYGDREKTYGEPFKNLTAIALFWNDYVLIKYGIKLSLSTEDICMMMVLLKIPRQANCHKQDNLTDGIGYFELIDRMHREMQEKITQGGMEN